MASLSVSKITKYSIVQHLSSFNNSSSQTMALTCDSKGTLHVCCSHKSNTLSVAANVFSIAAEVERLLFSKHNKGRKKKSGQVSVVQFSGQQLTPSDCFLSRCTSYTQRRIAINMNYEFFPSHRTHTQTHSGISHCGHFSSRHCHSCR